MPESRAAIDPMYDAVFLRVFGSPGSGPLTGALVNLVLQAVGEQPVEGLEIVAADASVIEGRATGKRPRLDVVLHAGNRWIDVEAERDPDSMFERMMHYAAKLQCSHMASGMSYADLPAVAVIALVDGGAPLSPGGGLVDCCRYCWDSTGEPDAAAGRSLLIAVDLAKARKRYTGLDEEVLADELASWLYLLSGGWTDRSEVGAMATRFKSIYDFAQRWGYALDDPQLEIEYDIYEKYENHVATAKDHAERRGLAKGLAEGREKGLAEGREKGLAEGRAEGRDALASNLLELGVDPALVKRAIAMSDNPEQ